MFVVLGVRITLLQVAAWQFVRLRAASPMA
jgi:hypothetical protein